MAKIIIAIEDDEDREGFAKVAWSKDTPGNTLDGTGTGAEQLAYYTLAMLRQAKYEGPPPEEVN